MKILNLNPKNINSTIERIKDDIDRLRRQIGKYKTEIIQDEYKIKEYTKGIGKLKKPGEKDLLEEKLIKYTDFLQKTISKQTLIERKELIKKIQDTANSIQKSIADINNIVIVYVEIDEEDYSLRFKDANGNPNKGHGAQNTLAKMSIISAIVKLSNEKKGDEYPFIADAPTSDFAEEFTNRFLESVSNTYKQGLIISKDLVKDIDEYEKMGFIKNIIKIEKECEEEIALSTNSITKII